MHTQDLLYEPGLGKIIDDEKNLLVARGGNRTVHLPLEQGVPREIEFARNEVQVFEFSLSQRQEIMHFSSLSRAGNEAFARDLQAGP